MLDRRGEIYIFLTYLPPGCAGNLLSEALPGDISDIRRVPPRPNLKYANRLKTGERKKLDIQGKRVRCIYLQSGIFIREDDFTDLQNRMLGEFKSESLISDFSISLAIRSIWEGQSFVNIVAFRGGNNRKYPPYHDLRFQAVACESYTIHTNT